MGKSKKKVVDLKPEKISDVELRELQSLVSAINKIQFDIGTLETQKHGLLHTIFQANEKLSGMQDDFKEKYGTNDIDIQTGVIKQEE